MLIIGLDIFFPDFYITQYFAVMILVRHSVVLHNYRISMKSLVWSGWYLAFSFLFNITSLSDNAEDLNGMWVRCSTSCSINKPTSSCSYMRVDYKIIDDRNRSIVVNNVDTHIWTADWSVKVCDPGNFFNAIYIVRRKTWIGLQHFLTVFCVGLCILRLWFLEETLQLFWLYIKAELCKTISQKMKQKSTLCE